MDTRALLATLRRGQTPDRAALEEFAHGLADHRVSDAQAGAFAMAVCLGGLGEAGRVALTLAMRGSGRMLDWAGIDKPVLDKHSTGGVGDCVSLVLAPALAVCGAAVPMISGRGLGHTGGTLDKLESIPGVTTTLDGARFRHVVETAGAAIVGASSDIAPADRRLYAVRDVTATVESLDLITASILSKKLAAGLDALVLDVKVGSGAFMKDMDAAEALAASLVRTANAAGCKTTALITDMDQPLVPSMGNALEIAEVARVLTGGRRGALFDICVALGGALLALGDLAQEAETGAQMIARAIDDGSAADAFGRMLALQGGPKAFMENWARFLPEATVIREVAADSDMGHITAMDGEALGLAVVALGGGRQVESDSVDPAVGYSDLLGLGARVTKGTVLGVVHAARPDQADQAAAALRNALHYAPEPPPKPDLVHAQVSG